MSEFVDFTGLDVVSSPKNVVLSDSLNLLSLSTDQFQKRWGDLTNGVFTQVSGCGKSGCTNCTGGETRNAVREDVQKLANSTEFFTFVKSFTQGFDISKVTEDISYIIGKFLTEPVCEEKWEDTGYKFFHPEAFAVMLFYSFQNKLPVEDTVESDETTTHSTTVSTSQNVTYNKIIDDAIVIKQMFVNYLNGTTLGLTPAVRDDLFVKLENILVVIVKDSKDVETKLPVMDPIAMLAGLMMGNPGGAGKSGMSSLFSQSLMASMFGSMTGLGGLGGFKLPGADLPDASDDTA